jgi:hypothetical protein
MRRVQIDGGAINKMKAAGNYNASKKQTKIKKEVTKEQPRPTKMRPSKVDVTHPNMLEKNIATLKRTNTCPNCYLKGANLGHKDGGVRVGFYGIDLNDANLRSANLQNINLQGAYLRRADLMGANLKGANLRGADLSGTNLRVANLYMAKFQGANLQGAKLDPEGIRIARTSGAINIPEATFMAKNQTLKPCPGTYKSTWNNCIGTRTYSDKAVYKGPWKSGKQHGQGTLTYLDGEKYVGSFKDGLHHGEGTITYPSGKVMKGIWENDKFKSERK